MISITQRSFPRRVGTISSVVMGLSWGIAGLGITPAGLGITPAGAIAEVVGLYAVLWGFTLIGFIGFAVAVLTFQRRLIPGRKLAQPEPLQTA